MNTSNLDRLIVSFPHSNVDCRNPNSHIQNHQTPIAIDIISKEGDDNPKTPRSVEHRIPVTPTAPPTPRKAKRVPINGKRKASCFPVVGVAGEFMVYMNAMLALNQTVYFPDIVVSDLGAGDHVKRLKLLPQPAYEASVIN